MLDAVINLKDNFTDTLKTVESSVSQFSRTSKKMGRDIQRTGRSVDSAGSFLTKGLTLPILGALGASAKLGIDFEKTMSGVEAVTGAAGKELEDLELKAREMGKSTTKSSSQAAEAMEYMGLAGWETTQIIEGIEPVLRLSEAGNLDLARASDLVTDSMSAMGIEVQDLDRYLDVVAQTARSSNTDIDAMMEAYLGVGGVLRGLDADLEDSAVALGMLANAGIKGSESGKSLSAILTNLTAPTGRAKKALDELGFSAFDAEGNFKGIDEVLFELKDTFKDMTPEQQNMYKSMIAGKEHTKGLNALLNGLDDTYEELSESIGDSEGALMTMAEIMNDNTAGSISRLLSSVQELALTIYDKMKPAIADVIEFFQGVSDKLNNLTPEQEDMIAKFVKMAIVIGPALKIIGKLTGGVGSLVKEFGFLAQRIGNVGFLKAIFTPGLKIALIFAAIVAAGILLYKNWDKIKAKAEELFPGIGETIKTVLGNIKDTIMNVVEVAGEIISIAFDTLKTMVGIGLEFIKQFWTDHGESIMEIVSLMWELIQELFILGAEWIKGVVSRALEWISTFWSNHGETIMNIAGIAWELIGGLISGAMTFIQGAINVVLGIIQGDWSRVWEGIKTMFQGVMDAIKAAWNAAKEIIGAAIEGAVDAITDKFHSAVDKAKEAWQTLKDFLSNPIKGTVNAVKKGAGWVKDKIGNNYQGTDNWRGGPTWVNEKGPEIIDLPSGSRVYPHSKSLDMARSEGRAEASKTGGGITVSVTGNTFHVRKESDIDAIASELANKLTDTALNMA